MTIRSNGQDRNTIFVNTQLLRGVVAHFYEQQALDAIAGFTRLEFKRLPEGPFITWEIKVHTTSLKMRTLMSAKRCSIQHVTSCATASKRTESHIDLSEKQLHVMSKATAPRATPSQAS